MIFYLKYSLRTTNNIKANWTSVSTFSKKQRNMQDQEAPLILGFDIKKIPPYAKAMALNTEIITVNQVPLGKSVYNKYDEIWTGPLNDGFVIRTLQKN
ncbi:hypothetical protein C2G38_2237626 [Gigaspora rosea]|uniref:Uncharacterized protein n=1 Tax=Gigaspora rosea TaxID=44941 RepID=A0A397TTS4_9GLOM|nr:hypothetical protein C2G38_2237626 [Gigaspora rosea]